MIKQQVMSPAVALYHWRENGMSIEKVLSQTCFTSIGELYQTFDDDMKNEQAAVAERMMSPDERQREEDVDATWVDFGDYLREFVPPSEYQDEIERLLPLTKTTRQIKAAAMSRPFRDAVRRRKAQ
ncbi:hypothetical protein F4V91_06785 [Neorhizobium galegae]|uniref:Uncharacterized protein n=1 Tax=Neorhizobium galegae TaxID=399 RepID=A0A6A1TRB7_NEOGA|nr:hypothetical protein [Neorhizobium galegae]KAB1086164.1 hypothetical protein F4V91_06785 [Neorhizobium galegae]